MPGTDWKGRNVLITGISGFIGCALARKLKELGINVVGLVREWNHVPWPVLDECTIINGDVCHYDTIRETMSFYEIDTVFHFAAFAIVRVAARDPMSTYRVNVMGTVNVLEAARALNKCKSIIVASSDKAYGDHIILPYTESTDLKPRNTYDTSKACMDMIARSYAHNYDMPVSVTRCSNVYGPGDMNLSRIIPNTIKRVLGGDPPLVFQDVSDMEREFIYIDDVVDAYLRLADNPTRGEAFNIGGTGPTKIYDLVGKISGIVGLDEMIHISKRDNIFKEIKRQYIDAGKLKAWTGWESTTGLHEGLEKTVEWYKAFYEDGTYL